MNYVLRYLVENQDRLQLGRYGWGQRNSCVFMTPRFRASNHLVALVLPEGSCEPAVVVKVPRLKCAGDALAREAAVLRFAEQQPFWKPTTVPRLIALEEYQGRPLLVQSGLPGRTMDPHVVRRRPAACCTTATGWLADVQYAVSHAEREARYRRLVQQPIERLASAASLPAAERRLLDRTRRLTEPLQYASLPAVLEHGDFGHPNLLLWGGWQLGVVDWEMADPAGLPGQDLFFFLTYVSFALGRVSQNGRYLAAIEGAFFDKSAWGRAHVADYARRLGLDCESLTPLFVLSWVRYLDGLLHRLQHADQSLSREVVHWLRRNRYFAAWQYSVENVNRLSWA